VAVLCAAEILDEKRNLLALMTLEMGKTLLGAIAKWRNVCRYYAVNMRADR